LKHALDFIDEVYPLMVESDSSAARAVLWRLGVGRIRHLEVKTLWVQAMVGDGRLKVRPVKGENNIANVGTKILSKPRIDYLKQLIGIRLAPSDTSAPICSQVLASHPARALRSLIVGGLVISAGGYASDVATCQSSQVAEGVPWMVTVSSSMSTPWTAILTLLVVILIATVGFLLGQLTARMSMSTVTGGNLLAFRRSEPQLSCASPKVPQQRSAGRETGIEVVEDPVAGDLQTEPVNSKVPSTQ
jgi:hypothetical protein